MSFCYAIRVYSNIRLSEIVPFFSPGLFMLESKNIDKLVSSLFKVESKCYILFLELFIASISLISFSSLNVFSASDCSFYWQNSDYMFYFCLEMSIVPLKVKFVPSIGIL